jgi:hypothetical protein
MARTTDFLTKQRRQITARLDELRPLYEEYLTLERAHEALDQLGEPIRRAVGRGPGRPPGSRTSSGARRGRPAARRTTTRRSTGRRTSTRRTTGRRAGQRSRAGGTRAEHTLSAIKSKPGITIPELANTLGIRPNYLYRVTAQLQKERKIRKRGRGFHAA